MKSTSTLLKSLSTENLDNDKGLKTDFPEFDQFTGGFKLGGLVLINGRVGMGVNHLTRCLVLNTSIRCKNSVGVFSLYQSQETYLLRLLATEAGISFHDLKRNNVSDANDMVKTAKELIAKAPIFISDAMSFSVQSIIAEVQEGIKWFGVKIVVIHGFNLLTDNTFCGISRYEELDRVASKLKDFAIYNDVTFVITHELPEMSSPNDNQEFCPTIREIYDDLSLAKYANLVTVLYRPEYYGIKTWPRFDESTECEAELRIVKNRNGNLESFRLFFDGYRSRFHEVGDDRYRKQPFTPNA
ncbi:DnaB-like helicase C-terminal domain-containing protein [Winogradskyella poriferorum]|uniref:DnaB-like helicase C-terminal domain-containing protein n=1 Tax=Winogradskyella poriferorum TaxID=307627 RepID=UPI003D652AE1